MRTEDQLARLRVAIASGYLPRDLGLWALRKLTPSAQRRRQRDELLRKAAGKYPGKNWSRGNELHKALQVLRADPEKTEFVDPALAAAFEIDPDCPSSLRQILNIIGD